MEVRRIDAVGCFKNLVKVSATSLAGVQERRVSEELSRGEWATSLTLLVSLSQLLRLFPSYSIRHH